ncbi:hypothetical protein L210DRAFT_3173621 [Boletus edulis BED1]|uniref:Crinkler effector protein N-terminal domain-containing protein n=1 Tax=Boletus edulis BED1 TaxID=1328754 RepID=A0AAD4G7N8_BOLED|nr:hypothetical protein L210DRAFT_3173621 [Boletus edulis BED1]
MDVLRLICWIRSQDPKVTFQVKISKTETVFDLQKAIKNEKSIAFRDADADTLRLYKPNYPVSRPYEDHLRKLILSKDGTLLEGAQELSEVFSEPPSKFNIHVIVDPPPSRIVCWLRGGTLDSRFQVKIPTTETVSDLQEAIKNKNPRFFCDVDAEALRLYKISGDESKLQEYLNETGGGERLQENTIARNFLDVPVLDPLRVVIDIVEIQIPTL